MIGWQHFLLPLAVLLASAVGGAVYAFWADVRASRSLPAVRSGRAITVPMMVGEGDAMFTAPGFRDGDEVRILSPRLNARLDRHEFDRSGVRRPRFDDDRFQLAVQRAFVGSDGERYLVGPLEDWEPAFHAMLAAPARPAGRWRPLRAAIPRSALAGMALGVLALGLFQGIWAVGHDVDARMVRVVGGGDEASCLVRWTDQGRAESAEVDCYEPFPQPGDAVRIRALAWPFDESAMDEEGTYEALTAITGGVALVSLLTGTAVAWRRLRRPVVVLRAAAPQDRIGGPAPADRRQVEVMGLGELAGAVATQEGWSLTAAAQPPQARPWALPLMALGAGRWWPAAVLLGLAWLPESLPRPVRLALTAGAAAVLAWAAWRSLTAWLAIRRATHGPVTSEWDYHLVRSVDDLWLIVLLLGQTPYWAVVLGTQEHPAPSGRCGVRGDLEEGGAVQLRIQGHFWVAASPVIRVDEEFLGDVREDLQDRLVEDPQDGIADPPTVNP